MNVAPISFHTEGGHDCLPLLQGTAQPPFAVGSVQAAINAAEPGPNPTGVASISTPMQECLADFAACDKESRNLEALNSLHQSRADLEVESGC